MMEVVEVIKGVETSEETMQAGVGFVKAIGKEPIRVESDVSGFLLNRIHLIGYVEGIRLLEQGIGTDEGIDQGVRLAFKWRMGPFETGDLVGLDVSCGALTAIYEESKDIRYFPLELLGRKGKLPAHRKGLPEKEVSFILCPWTPLIPFGRDGACSGQGR